ncbi:MAG: carboxymuconolactone decarboxylase family protein [Phycisphaerae bacterium]
MNQADEKAKRLLDGVQQALGMTPNFMRTLAHSAAALEAHLAFGKALGKGNLGAKLREQIALTVANASSCQYCASAHTALGNKLGLSEAEAKASLDATSEDPKVQAVLRFARNIVENRGWVSEQAWSDLRQAGYSDGQVAEIIATVGINLFTNYFNHIAETEIDFPVVDVAEPAAV